MLAMSPGDLPTATGVAKHTIAGFEMGQSSPYPRTITALESAGVEFIEENGGAQAFGCARIPDRRQRGVRDHLAAFGVAADGARMGAAIAVVIGSIGLCAAAISAAAPLFGFGDAWLYAGIGLAGRTFVAQRTLQRQQVRSGRSAPPSP